MTNEMLISRIGTWEHTNGRKDICSIFHLSEITALEKRQSYDGVCNKDSMTFCQNITEYHGHKTCPLRLKISTVQQPFMASWDLKQKSIKQNQANAPQKHWVQFSGFYCSIICTFWCKNQIHLCDLNCMLIMLLHEYVALHAVWQEENQI